LSDLASKAFTPSAVRDEPKIHIGRSTEQNAEEQSSSPVSRNLRKNRNEDRGDVLIHSLWANKTDCIIDVHITDIDAKSNRTKDPMKVLETHECEKKKKYLEPCLEQ
jgi:hypothetical protein